MMKYNDREKNKRKVGEKNSKIFKNHPIHITCHHVMKISFLFYWDLKVWVVYGPPINMFFPLYIKLVYNIYLSDDHQ